MGSPIEADTRQLLTEIVAASDTNADSLRKLGHLIDQLGGPRAKRGGLSEDASEQVDNAIGRIETRAWLGLVAEINHGIFFDLPPDLERRLLGEPACTREPGCTCTTCYGRLVIRAAVPISTLARAAALCGEHERQRVYVSLYMKLVRHVFGLGDMRILSELSDEVKRTVPKLVDDAMYSLRWRDAAGTVAEAMCAECYVHTFHTSVEKQAILRLLGERDDGRHVALVDHNLLGIRGEQLGEMTREESWLELSRLVGRASGHEAHVLADSEAYRARQEIAYEIHAIVAACQMSLQIKHLRSIIPDLEPTNLPAAIMQADPFSYGSTLVVRAIEADTTDVWTVYSVGPNGTDDGGPTVPADMPLPGFAMPPAADDLGTVFH